MRILFVILSLMVSACGATQTVTPLQNQKYRIDISAPSSYSRAETQALANEKAALATLENGFDRFIILSGRSWTETEIYTDTYYDRDPFRRGGHRHDPYYDYGNFSKSVSVVRNPETTMVIKMLKNSDKDAENAIDAKEFLDKLDKR